MTAAVRSPGRHHRHRATAAAQEQYERLVVTLHHHQPARRSGLCLDCGFPWPCAEVRALAEPRWPA